MTSDESRTLWCLIEGDAKLFQVTAPVNASIHRLKELILDKRKYGRLKGVDAIDLILCKVDIDLSNKTDDSLTRMNVKADNETKLTSWNAVSYYWSAQPSDNALHVFVKNQTARVASRKRPHPSPNHEGQDGRAPPWPTSPSALVTLSQSSALQRKSVDEKINKELESLEGELRTFLEHPELPTWVPPDYVVPGSREFLTNLRLPCYRDGTPSLLFHDLDACEDDKIKEIFGASDRPLCICNTSGSGKTRRILEGLTKYWGFYLVAIPDSNGVGVGDMKKALDRIEQYREWVPDLRSLSNVQRAGQNKLNRWIASKQLLKVLAARIVVFQRFLELAAEIDGDVKEKHKRIWLLFQLSDNRHSAHPFVRIMNCLDQASSEALDQLIGRIGGIRDKHLPSSPFIIALDDAQVAHRLSRHSFVSLANPEVFRSILRELAAVSTRWPLKLVVSGTGVSLEELEEAVASGSGVSKPRAVELFHELGMFDEWPKLKQFIERYVPASILESPSGSRLQLRMREHLLGRYRFSVSFLELFLLNGLQSPHTLLNEFIKTLATCYPGDDGSPFTSQEPQLRIKVKLMGFAWDRLLSDPEALRDAARVVQPHLTWLQPPSVGPVTVRLVEYGIARLRDEHSGQVLEPLAILSLMKWLQTQPLDRLESNIRHRLSLQDARGLAYEELLVLYLHRALRYKTPLSTIFDFHPAAPSWADAPAQLVGRFEGTNVPVDILGKAPQNPGLGAVHYAETPEEIIQWIENPDTTPPILLSTHLWGIDVAVRLQVYPSNTAMAPITVFVMGQAKSYTTGNKETLDATTMAKAVNSLNEDHWFVKMKKDAPARRQKFINAMKNHSILGFIGAYPLLPRLPATAESVKQAISALGPNVTLVSINLHAFKAEFLSLNDWTNVLTPMEHALSRKRKAKEVDGCGWRNRLCCFVCRSRPALWLVIITVSVSL